MTDAGTNSANELIPMLDLGAQYGARRASGAASGAEALAAPMREEFGG